MYIIWLAAVSSNGEQCWSCVLVKLRHVYEAPRNCQDHVIRCLVRRPLRLGEGFVFRVFFRHALSMP